MSRPVIGHAERKRLMLARAELERRQIRLAGSEMRALLAPVASGRRTSHARPRASALLAVAVPLLGATRLGRLLRIASIGLGALRLARSLKR
ncbi:MAG: hypothetical protein WCZ28_04000 [Burkholderiaceae bacterium]